jgi:hypothetical protein
MKITVEINLISLSKIFLRFKNLLILTKPEFQIAGNYYKKYMQSNCVTLIRIKAANELLLEG